MEQLLNTWNKRVEELTKPNPKQYPDSTIHQYQWDKNIIVFYMTGFYMIFVTVFFTICNFSFFARLAYIGLNILIFLTFIALCRSTYLWIFNALYVFISLTYGFGAFDLIPEAAYCYSGYIFMIVTCVLLYSGDVWVTLFVGGYHTILCLTRFREKLVTLIIEEEPEIFIDKYMRFLLFFFILLVFSQISLVTMLNKRSIELLRVKSALESALEQQKTFLFSFSHELRNPINSLLGNLQLVLQGEPLSPRAAEMINVAKVCGEILLHNINNVLDIGKHEIGKLEVNLVETQLDGLFHRTWSIYSEILRQKNLKGFLRLDKNIPAVVKTDAHSLNQILLNLIGNSIKFTEKGLVTVTVKWLKNSEMSEKRFEPIPYDDVDEGLFEKEENLSAVETSRFSEGQSGFQGLNDSGRQNNYQVLRSQPHQASKGILKIIVKDTGSGMKKEALDRLFQKFSQVSENISHRQIGTGLGLFITREICHAMNGEIRAYSKARVGSTFIVCLPMTTVPFSNISRAGSEAVMSQLSQKQLKALVADDSPFNVNLICNYLSEFGASVVSVAYNGYDIFMKYKEFMTSNTKIDVITLDIDMPIMDGRIVCNHIRQYEKENRLRPIVIILISGNYDKEQIVEYIDSEKANCFLRKPVSFSEFSRAVYNLVGTS